MTAYIRFTGPRAVRMARASSLPLQTRVDGELKDEPNLMRASMAADMEPESVSLTAQLSDLANALTGSSLTATATGPDVMTALHHAVSYNLELDRNRRDAIREVMDTLGTSCIPD